MIGIFPIVGLMQIVDAFKKTLAPSGRQMHRNLGRRHFEGSTCVKEAMLLVANERRGRGCMPHKVASQPLKERLGVPEARRRPGWCSTTGTGYQDEERGRHRVTA